MTRKYLEMIEQKHDELVEAYIAEKKDIADCCEGMHTELRLWEDGTIDTSDLLSTNSWTQGEFTVVAHVSTGNIFDNFDPLKEVQSHEKYDEIKNAYTDKEQDDDFLSAEFCEFIEREYPEIVDELKKDYKEWALDDTEEYARDEAIDRIAQTITELKNAIKWEEADRDL